MSTTPVETWATDLTQVGPIYPMVGSEFVLFVIGLALWIAWHVWQMRFENRTYEDELRHLDNPAKLERAMHERRLE